tara:strand:- start:3452 stop:3928 length:477 start_codon:yes stop_codon:yes gene_type:complete
MLLAIKQFFEDKLSVNAEQAAQQNDKRIELATAALMFELMRTDARIDEREKQALTSVLGETFELGKESLEELLSMAETAATEATSLYEFTSLINESYSYDQRVQLVENLWRVAFADLKLDRYEEHMIRNVSDLIYVRHSDFIRTKLKVKEALTDSSEE